MPLIPRISSREEMRGARFDVKKTSFATTRRATRETVGGTAGERRSTRFREKADQQTTARSNPEEQAAAPHVTA
jgi:hypothetical protein